MIGIWYDFPTELCDYAVNYYNKLEKGEIEISECVPFPIDQWSDKMYEYTRKIEKEKDNGSPKETSYWKGVMDGIQLALDMHEMLEMASDGKGGL